jgi:hypothetical protein
VTHDSGHTKPSAGGVLSSADLVPAKAHGSTNRKRARVRTSIPQERSADPIGVVQLHIGNPGEDGIKNSAIETTRKLISFTPAFIGGLSSDIDLTWKNIAGSENATYFTIWDDLVEGNFLFSGTISGDPYIAGDTFTIPSGSLTVSLTLAT